MANFCFYQIKAIGPKKAVLLFSNILPILDYLDVDSEGGTDEKYTMELSGNCKWSVNFNCKELSFFKVNLDDFDEDSLRDGQGNVNWIYATMRQKSEVLGLELQIRYWSDESDFDQFDHYINGKCVKQRKIAFWHEDDSENEFDWETLEYVGYEGVYDQNVKGEENDAEFLRRLLGPFSFFK